MNGGDVRIDLDRLLGRIAELGEIGRIDGPAGEWGNARLALTDDDRRGRELVVSWMRDLGMSVAVDGIGNVFATRPGSDPLAAPVMTGSHIDTVRTGGRYDGNLGVLAGLEVAETLEQLTEGELHFILDDPTAQERREKVERLVLCTGKVYYDMDGNERRGGAENVAIARVEVLYPFAKEQLERVIASYPNLKEIAWVQEEPRNMGAWKVMSRRMPDVLPEGVKLTYIGRQGRASPGEGYSGAHAREQERIVLTALTPNS